MMGKIYSLIRESHMSHDDIVGAAVDDLQLSPSQRAQLSATGSVVAHGVMVQVEDEPEQYTRYESVHISGDGRLVRWTDRGGYTEI